MSKALIKNLYIENANAASNVILFSLSIALKKADGTPLNTLSGATGSLVVKNSYTDITTVATVTNGITFDSINGIVSLDIKVSDLTSISKTLPEQAFIYDYDIIDNTNTHYRLLKGTLTIAGNL